MWQDAPDFFPVQEKALANHAQEHFVAAGGEHEVNISSGHFLLSKKGAGDGLPLEAVGLQDAQLSHAGEPEGAVLGVAEVVGLEGNGGGTLQGEILGIIAVQAEAAGRYHPKAVFPVQRQGLGPEGIQLPDDGAEEVFLRNIGKQAVPVGKEEFPAAGFQDLPQVAVGRFRFDAVEVSFQRRYYRSQPGGGPDAPVRKGVYVADLVVRETTGVVRGEELLELCAVITVEASLGGHPDMSVAVFCERVHPLVGDAVCNDYTPRCGSGEIRPVILTCSQEEKPQGSQDCFSVHGTKIGILNSRKNI